MNDVFIYTIEELENLECECDLEFCGMSGTYYSYKWFYDNTNKRNIYFKLAPHYRCYETYRYYILYTL